MYEVKFDFYYFALCDFTWLSFYLALFESIENISWNGKNIKKNKCDFKNILPHCITFWYHILDKKVQFLKMTSFKSSFPVFYLHFTAKKLLEVQISITLGELASILFQSTTALIYTLRVAGVSTFLGKMWEIPKR